MYLLGIRNNPTGPLGRAEKECSLAHETRGVTRASAACTYVWHHKHNRVERTQNNCAMICAQYQTDMVHAMANAAQMRRAVTLARF